MNLCLFFADSINKKLDKNLFFLSKFLPDIDPNSFLQVTQGFLFFVVVTNAQKAAAASVEDSNILKNFLIMIKSTHEYIKFIPKTRSILAYRNPRDAMTRNVQSVRH